MPGFHTNSPSQPSSQPRHEHGSKTIEMSRQQVITMGIASLNTIGSNAICKVCIKYGGSCCNGCQHLVDRVGCSTRNTSCTAWLCGYLKYVLYATDQLKEWDDFWDQVPGQSYREDDTPEVFSVEKTLYVHNIQKLCVALADDLQELETKHVAIAFILTLREKIDKNIDQLHSCHNDANKRRRIERNIKELSRPFHRFQMALRDYQLNEKTCHDQVK